VWLHFKLFLIRAFFFLAYVVAECRWEFMSKIVKEAEYVERMGKRRN
jgi:hypothetical protein